MAERPEGYKPGPRAETPNLITGNFKEAEQRDLAGKLVVITGASRGIGAALAYQAALRGVSGLVLASTRASIEELLAVGNHSAELGVKTVEITADVTDPEATQVIYDTSKRIFGDMPTILISNAGVTGDMPLHEHTLETWRAPIDVKVLGAFNLIRPFVADWAERAAAAKEEKRLGDFETPGTIVLVSSIAVKTIEDPDAAGSYILKGNSHQTSYSAANAALLGLGQALRQEHRSTKALKVVTVLPGIVDTRLTSDMNAAFEKMALRSMGDGKRLNPHEAAHEILNAAMYAQNGAVVEIVR